MFIWVNGLKIKLMAKEFTYLNLELNMLANGLMIDKMEMGRSIGLIKLFISDSIKMEKNTVKANLCGLMTAHIKEISYKIIFMDMENINGRMAEYIKENGKIIKCREKALLHGQMEENI